jgi:2-amino-4-hydroxy-6-hydroxymethyldihydropteridine diphosphokinase
LNQFVEVAIGLGSNLSDRQKKIEEAALILASEVLEDAVGSCVFESNPWGDIKDQPNFLNAVIRGKCEWKPPALVNYLKNLERQLGRRPGPRFGPRVIDLDLIAVGNMIWDTDGVKVPHPYLQERDFVLLPLKEVWPTWVDPRSGKSVEKLYWDLLKSGPSTAKVFAPRLLNTTTR